MKLQFMCNNSHTLLQHITRKHIKTTDHELLINNFNISDQIYVY